MPSQLDLGFFFKFRNDIVVVSVEPFLHRKSTDISFFPLIATSQGKIPLQVSQLQPLNRWRHHVKEKGRIKHIVIVRKVIWRNLWNSFFLNNIPVLSAQLFGRSQKLFCWDFMSKVFFSCKFQFAEFAQTRETNNSRWHKRPPKFFLILSYQKIPPLYNWNFPEFDIA